MFNALKLHFVFEMSLQLVFEMESCVYLFIYTFFLLIISFINYCFLHINVLILFNLFYYFFL